MRQDPVRLFRQAGIGMEKNQQITRSPFRTFVHLPGAAAGTDNNVISQRRRFCGGSVRAAAVNHNHLMAGPP